MPGKSERDVAHLLAEVTRREGVETCFALLGDANMSFATRLMQMGARLVTVRHEHCAVAAATAYARATGEGGFATVTCGPGLTQVLTALPAAVRSRTPLLIFAGEAPLSAGWYNQEIDQAPFVAAAGARYRRLHHVRRMAEALRDAFLLARTERVPVVVGVPFDLQAQTWPGLPLPEPSATLVPEVGPLPPDPDDVARAARLVAAARRIVVMAGRGAVAAGAGPACRALAAKVGGLLATTLPARGLFAGEPFSIGIAGGFSSAAARACFAEADLVIAVGGRLAQHNTDRGKLWPKAEVLQIDIDPLTISQGQIVARHHLRADARLGVLALSDALEPRGRSWRSDALARFIAETPPDPAEFENEPGLFDPRDVVAALDAALPREWEMVNSSGHCSFYVAQMASRPVERFHTIREFGAIGNGISYAIGVAAARPDRTVVLFDGDGSLLMHVQELETIRRLGLNVLICVLNDGAYGSEIHKLRAEGLPDDGAVFGRTDLAAIARGFGLAGETPADLEALPDLARTFARTGGAAVWDFRISDRVASPVIRRAHPEAHGDVERPVTLPEEARA
ncbi:MAG TPA: thiamine pyrophosphate-dependent enzyme [Geminicoccaceae bacterium]